MAENLNVGTIVNVSNNQTNNRIIEKYCYNGDKNYCEIYGGLYQWDELMQYNLSDDKIIGTTQGICPVGWHLPTRSEYNALIDYLGSDVGGKLKETGTKEAGTGFWLSPNTGATNESGFSARPGGRAYDVYVLEGSRGFWWSGTKYIRPFYLELFNEGTGAAFSDTEIKEVAKSVRCVKNPPIK
jgi:uncharacterized protein (TIGR02145 family)